MFRVVLSVTLVLITACSRDSLPSGIDPCDQANLRPEVDVLVAPVVSALKEAAGRGDWFDSTYEAAFYDLLESSDPWASEARVALLRYYVGEHYGGELLATVSSEGEAARAQLEAYRECRPQTSAGFVPPNLTNDNVLYDMALELLLEQERPGA
jgi:hypothetical protein